MMPLLFDHHLSPKLILRLLDLYPGSTHVSFVSRDRAEDRTVWAYARQHRYILVTKDADFGDLQLLYGFLPKII